MNTHQSQTTLEDVEHNGPRDRGQSDFWYSRPFSPHRYTDGVKVTNLTKDETSEYNEGYREYERNGLCKDY